MDLHSLDLVLVIISCFIVLGVDFTDGQEIIKNRTFVSKARAEFIRVIPPYNLKNNYSMSSLIRKKITHTGRAIVISK